MNGHFDIGDYYRGVSAVVLGASGFIGMEVSRQLYACGAKLHLFVRNRRAAEESLYRYMDVRDVFEADLKDRQSTTRLLTTIKPTIVFNLAGYGVDPSERDESIAYRVNAELVETICAAMATIRNPRWRGQDVVHAGSALEYGAAGGELAEDSPTFPSTVYGKSKLAGTRLLERCCMAFDIKGVTARLFTVYGGTGEHRARLLPALIDAARTGKPLLLTDGSQKRDFTYIEDAAEGLLRIGAVRAASPGEVVNLATGKLTSVRRFAETAAEILRIPPERLIFGGLPTRPEEMFHRAVSLQRLRQLVGWIPATTVDQGIRKTLDRVWRAAKVKRHAAS